MESERAGAIVAGQEVADTGNGEGQAPRRSERRFVRVTVSGHGRAWRR